MGDEVDRHEGERKAAGGNALPHLLGKDTIIPQKPTLVHYFVAAASCLQAAQPVLADMQQTATQSTRHRERGATTESEQNVWTKGVILVALMWTGAVALKMMKDQKTKRKSEKEKATLDDPGGPSKDESKATKLTRGQWRFANAWRDPYGVLHLPPTTRNAFLNWQARNRFGEAAIRGTKYEPSLTGEPLPDYDWSDTESETSVTSSLIQSRKDAYQYLLEEERSEDYDEEEEEESDAIEPSWVSSGP